MTFRRGFRESRVSNAAAYFGAIVPPPFTENLPETSAACAIGARPMAGPRG